MALGRIRPGAGADLPAMARAARLLVAELEHCLSLRDAGLDFARGRAGQVPGRLGEQPECSTVT